MNETASRCCEMTIPKRASNLGAFARPTLPFSNARSAFKAFLQALDFSPDDEVLLPAYVGWSPREGSGVFDPIQELGIKLAFYRVTRGLAIDLEHLRAQIDTRHPRLLVLIHYFGYPDPAAREAAAYAREKGVLVLEDEAHALYSDWIGGICGRLGDAVILSLHKMLPFDQGGLLVLNPSLDPDLMEELRRTSWQQPLEHNPLDYDLVTIAAIRRSNTARLLQLLRPSSGRVDPLYPELPEGVVPQSLPVVITGRSRDELYFRLNELGYGVVSLYHTLIEPIRLADFPDSHWLSRRILNLPVHQDVSARSLEALVGRIADCF